MSKRSREEQKKQGVSKYQLWILVGLLLGYKIIPFHKNKRQYVFISRTGELIEKQPIHSSAVNAMVGKYIDFTDDKKTGFRLTTPGFTIAHDRLKRSNVDLNSGYKPVQQYKMDEIDSSMYVG